jgi:hypothetical protein
MKRELSGSLAVAQGKRVRFELKETKAKDNPMPGAVYWLTICDGKRALHHDTGTPKPLVHDVGLDDPLADYSTLLARSGLLLVTFTLPPVGAHDMKERFPVSELKLGPTEKLGEVMAPRLDYRLDVKGQKQPNGEDAPFQASVWLDPESSLPLKRTITWKFAGVQVIAIGDEYKNPALDKTIDPKTFQVPGDDQ